VFDALAAALEGLGDVVTRTSKSQIAFRVRRGFAFLWRPGQYVRSDAPAVLSLALPYKLASLIQRDEGLWSP
jgi:hypothetical protein